MLCVSPSNMDSADPLFNSAYDSHTYNDTLDPFSRDELLAFIRDSMPTTLGTSPELPAASSQSVNDFIQSSDVLESISLIDSLPALSPDGLISGFCADDLIDQNFLYTDSSGIDTTDTSADTTPNISPNYECQEAVTEGKKVVYWNKENSMPGLAGTSAQQSLEPSRSAATSEVDKFINFRATDKSDEKLLVEDSITQLPVDNEEFTISAEPCPNFICPNSCVCAPLSITDLISEDNLDLDIFENIGEIDTTEYAIDSSENDYSKKASESVLIHPSGGDVLFSDPSSSFNNLDLSIPSSSSENVGIYEVKDQLNSSFNSLEECKVVKPSEVCPSFHRDQEIEPPIRSVLSSHNENFGSIKIKTEYSDSESIESDPPESKYAHIYIPFIQRPLRPIDMVKKDHCYTKTQLTDQPESPVPAPSPLWNAYLGDMNSIEVPVKRRPGRPRKSTTTVPAERQSKVIVQKPPQKRSRKPSQMPSKRIKLNNGSSVRNDKREQHNRAERERRFALRNSMISVAGQCPEHVLHLTNVALTATKHERSEEEIENNFTVEVVRRVDELVKKGDYDIKKLKTKKSQNFSKMIMLLSITYHIISLEKELKFKENRLSYNENLLKQAKNKLYRRTKLY